MSEQTKPQDKESQLRYEVLWNKATEPPNTGKFQHHKDPGVYTCGGCGVELYTSQHKFDSHCGWPSFFDAIPGRIKRQEDRSFGSVRTEIVCAKCGGHLGHVFKGEGYNTPTDERHCVNSISLDFKEGEK